MSTYVESRTGYWSNDDSFTSRPFLCKTTVEQPPIEPEIPPGYCPSFWAEYGSNCYQFFDSLVGQPDAEFDCSLKCKPQILFSP